MAKVILHEIDTYVPFLLDTDGPLNPESIRQHGEKKARGQGFFSVRKVGLVPPRVRELVAVFVDENALWMVIKNRLYDLSRGGMTAIRKRHIPGARKFVLVRGSEVLVSFTYWNTCGRSAEGSEIFEFAERVTKDDESKVSFKRIWTAYHDGQDLNDIRVLKALESGTTR